MTVTGATKVLAIFGNPVTHSLSPQMHAGWIADHGIDATYVPLRLHPDQAYDTFRALKRLGLHGANVTVPFKEDAARAADICSEDAATLGVANTLVWTRDALHAHNTDWAGARAALDEAVPGWTGPARNVLVIGAGGAARAMAFGLIRDGGPSVTVVNRTREKADAVARFLAPFGAAAARDWSDLPGAVAAADVIVNASTLGMKGLADMDWPLDRAKPGAIVYDAVYAPLETSFLKTARARNLRTVDGLGMLIHQGALAFEIWFGVRPDTQKARERLLAILAARP